MYYGQDAIFVPWNKDTLPKPTMECGDVFLLHGKWRLFEYDVTIDNLDKVDISQARWFKVIRIYDDYYTINFNKQTTS
jgi:hypothetical protein